MEILRQCQGPIDAIFVADRRRRPHQRHRGVRQARAARRSGSSACSRSTPTRWRARSPPGRRVKLAARRACSPTASRSSRSARRRSASRASCVDEMVLVDTDATCAAMKDVFEDTRSILEPAGALAIAGVKAWCARHRVEGPHLRRDRLRRQHELRPAALRRRARRARRAARGDPRRDDPRAAGQLPRVLPAARQALGHRVQLPLRRPDGRAPLRRHRGRRPRTRPAELLARAASGAGSRRYDLSDNEMAKLHVRHLVGGHAPAAENEILYRFEFPERPGRADAVPGQHERAAGTSACSTTATTAPTTAACWSGMQVPPADKAEFRAFLDRLGYDYVDETRQSGLPDVPRALSARSSRAWPRRGCDPRVTLCRAASGSPRETCRDVAFGAKSPADADSGKLYALGTAGTGMAD